MLPPINANASPRLYCRIEIALDGVVVDHLHVLQIYGDKRFFISLFISPLVLSSLHTLTYCLADNDSRTICRKHFDEEGYVILEPTQVASTFLSLPLQLHHIPAL